MNINVREALFYDTFTKHTVSKEILIEIVKTRTKIYFFFNLCIV